MPQNFRTFSNQKVSSKAVKKVNNEIVIEKEEGREKIVNYGGKGRRNGGKIQRSNNNAMHMT